MSLHLIISDNNYIYGKFTIEKHKFNELPQSTTIIVATEAKRKCFFIDSVFFHYLKKELELSAVYRSSFLRTLSRKKTILLILKPTTTNLIDYNWNDRVYYMVRERCELDHALSWLSTLGGAFSALGDYFMNCAETAGKISFHQLQLAMRLDDPLIASRCRLYLSLSLIQRQRFKLAKYIISQEFESVKKSNVNDMRLIKMCKGIWSKLQYEYGIYRNNKKLQKLCIKI